MTAPRPAKTQAADDQVLDRDALDDDEDDEDETEELDEVSDEVTTNAVRALQEAPGNAEERVLAMSRAFAEWAATQPERALVAVVHASATGALRARRHELISSFADITAREAASLYGDRAWPSDLARVQGIVFIGGLAELVASWLAGEVDMDTEELAGVVAELFVSLSRRT